MEYSTTVNPTKEQLQSVLAGLSFMILNTLGWTTVGEIALHGRDYWLIGVLFAGIVIAFLTFYARFQKATKQLPAAEAVATEDQKKSKRFIYIFIAEGAGILILKNVLVNIGCDDWFLPGVALIVGLHFFPLAKVFNRKFDYYMGVFVCLVAIAGFVLLSKGYATAVTTPVVSIGCAIATSLYGTMMIGKGNKILQEK
ncbi:MAG: hypothetical protein J7623_28670 [Chitinophaga sp.]|uniref:hypothetical protein n=1 Tax=Chitinophaga sp. TaxID=1869181 RepID=UPI001B035B9B|nr:hypothetical protein [Chitinophaga sp.]MBO9732651.1 hypothetical protein [Chitinophaga sp.]